MSKTTNISNETSRSVFCVLQTHNQATTGWEWDVGRLVQYKLCPKPTDCCTYYVSGMVGAGIDGSLPSGKLCDLDLRVKHVC